MSVFGPIVIWAVLGKKWAIAVFAYANLPRFIESSFSVYYTIRPFIPIFQTSLNQCKIIQNITLFNRCMADGIRQNMTIPSQIQAIHSLGNQSRVALPKLPKLPSIPLWLPFALEGGLLFILILRLNRIKNRIRRSIAHLYGFRRASNDN